MHNDTEVTVSSPQKETLSAAPQAERWVLLERYRLLELVGQGGMGKVYRVVDLNDNSIAAVKVMHNHLKSDASSRLRFEREARLAVGLKHANVLEVTNYGLTDENEPFIVMEFLVGESLDEFIQRRKPPLAASMLVPIFMQICAGLHYAHQSGVVHRDMKPSNIMLIEDTNSDRLHVKIVDFGIAKVCKTTGEVCPTSGKPLDLSITQPGEIFGSPLYMSPEQCFGEEVNCRSEVYSLGCMMFESLTGTAPLRGKNARETFLQRMSGQAPRLSDIYPEGAFPKQLENIISRCLQRDPEDRFESVANLSIALSECPL